MKRCKTYSKKVMSLLLAIIMAISVMPYGAITAEAAIDSRVEKAISWAIDTANDDTHGYSQEGRTGPDYDCSSFVSTAFKKGGFNVSGSLGTGNMKDSFVKKGFTVYKKGSVSLKRGDIMLRPATSSRGGHTELYIGDNKCVAAHSGTTDSYGKYSNGEKKGDQTGKEIEVRSKNSCSFCKKADYTYILRYNGSSDDSSSKNSSGYSLCWPVSSSAAKIGKISSAFGPRNSPTSGASTNHRGIDIPVKKTNVYCAADGKVTKVGNSNARGKYIVIYHETINLSTLYQHLEKVNVKAGDKVLAGSVIAKSGNTGIGTGYHLHFGVMKGKATSPDYDQPSHNSAINPLSSNISYCYYDKIKKYTLSGNDIPDSRTNTTNKITANLNSTAKVQSWGYYYGTSESDVKAHKKGSEKSNFVTVKAYNKNGESMKKLTTTVKKLKPNKKYYYVIAAKIGDKWYYSNSFYGKTKNEKPNSTTLKISNTYTDIGIKDTATVTWSAASGADTYTVKLFNSSNKEIYSKSGIKGTTCTFPASCFTSAGTYNAKLYAVNAAGTTTCSGDPTITVHNNVIVTFVDSISGDTITKQSVKYKGDAIAPQTPTQPGHTFKNWDTSFTNVKTDITVTAEYTENVYTVKFVDGLTGKTIGDTQRVKYGHSALAPQVPDSGAYEWIGWDIDYTNITGDTTVTANYKWYDEDSSIHTEIIGIKKIENKDKVSGYNVTVQLENGLDEAVQGRLVVALKSQTGLQLTTTESSAFNLNEKESKRTVTVFVPYSDFAYKVSVYTINDFESAGPIAQPVSSIIDNSDEWSGEMLYEDLPEDVKNGAGTIEVVPKTSKVTQYSYRTKSTTTSYSTSMNGWTQNGGSWVSQGQTTVNYPKKSFPSGFNTSNSLYKKYAGNKKVSASENSTTKVVVNSDTTKGYIYWHWCRGENVGAIDRKINWSKTSTYDTFHAFESTTKKSYKSSANAYKWQNTSHCKDTYWWNGRTSKTDELITINTEKYTTYKKLFNYYKWSDWSDWSTTRQSTSSTKEERSRVVDGETVNYYKYKTDNPATDPFITDEKQVVNISGTVNKDFAGKKATLFVYKYTQTADYTIEYTGETTIGSNGEILIENAKLREAPTAITGDYTIVASISGCTEAIEIGKIKAPKPIYSVKFYDFDGETVIYQQTVEQGGTVTAPSADMLTTPEGYKFTNWDQSTVNVYDNLDVKPQCEKEIFNVVFVDWDNHNVTIEEYRYGEQINPPVVNDKDGVNISWDMSGATKSTIETEDGIIEDAYIVTQNTVITTMYEEEVCSATFLSPEIVEEKGDLYELTQNEDSEDALTENDILSNELESYELVYSERVDTPLEIEESPDYIFEGWKNISNGEYLEDTAITENALYYPVYEFAQTVEVPEADVKTGEYDYAQTVTLSCETENAVIYYTTDGTDPAESDTAIEYAQPITLAKSCTLQFCAMAMGMNNSGTVAELYAINTSSSGRVYHIVTVYPDLPQAEGKYYQALIKDSVLFKDDELKNIEGYEYDGLYTDEAMTIPFFNDSEVISESVILYAHYIPNVYTANFNDEDGNLIASVKANYGESAEEPAVPEKAGYVFVGWDSDDYLCMTQDGTFTVKYVSEDEYANVEFTIKNYAKECMAGTYLDLNRYVKITPEDKVDTELIWSSSDSTVAAVDDSGLVEMIEPGMTTITVMVESSGETVSIEFTVTPDPNRQITLNNNSILGFDSNRNLREIPDGKNTVAELKDEFINDELHFYSVNGNELLDSDRIGTGTVVKLLDDKGEVIDEVTSVMTGDFDGDGVISNRDEVMLSQYVVGKREATLLQQIAVDVNNDKRITVVDCAVLSRYRVGKDKFAQVELSDN